ncbi:unnamed protein product [Mesocestoides corti]|nr:unnamed protein product [Mesocestoides corti]
MRVNLTDVRSFDWIIQLKDLISLNLSHCGLKSFIIPGFGDEFSRLTEIDISYNDLSFLYLPFISNAPELQTLDISHNKFRTFPDLSSSKLVVNIMENPLVCNCANVQLSSQVKFVTSNFACALPPCPYFLSFDRNLPDLEMAVSVAGNFGISCSVNASNPVQLGVFSPIGFIPDSSWESNTYTPGVISYEYMVLPVQRPVHLTVQRTAHNGIEVTVDYARGHHAGVWRCGALSDGGFILDNRTTTVIIRTGIDHLFQNTSIIGFIVMGSTLVLGLIIGSVRYLVETRCCTRPQSHKFFVRPLIGIIPVPSIQTQIATFVDEISLNQRICSSCLMQPCFLCGYCLSVHTFSQFEVLASGEGIPDQPPPHYKRSTRLSQCDAENPSLLSSDCSPTLDRKTDAKTHQNFGDAKGEVPKIVGNGIDATDKSNGSAVLQFPHKNVLNYDFPSEFCHCCHLDMRFTDDGKTRTSAAQRDVKLVFRDEGLAQEYTEALKGLQAAAKSNDAATFRDRLEEFREKLVRDVGARVRVVREGIVALKEMSAKSVARLMDQGGVVANLMKTGFSQMKDGMRSMAEMCTGGAGGGSTTGLETIGQSISVVSIYRDETTNKPVERCVSSFNF